MSAFTKTKLLTVIISTLTIGMHPNIASAQLSLAPSQAQQILDFTKSRILYNWVYPFLEENAVENLVSFKSVRLDNNDRNLLFFVSFKKSDQETFLVHGRAHADFYGIDANYGYSMHSLMGTVKISSAANRVSALFTSDLTDGFEAHTRNASLTIVNQNLQATSAHFTAPSGQFEGWFIASFEASDPVELSSMVVTANFLKDLPQEYVDSGPIYGAIQKRLFETDSNADLVMTMRVNKTGVTDSRCYKNAGNVHDATFQLVFVNSPFKLKSITLLAPEKLSVVCQRDSNPRLVTMSNASGDSFTFNVGL